jgi:hypothetical protein
MHTCEWADPNLQTRTRTLVCYEERVADLVCRVSNSREFECDLRLWVAAL